MTRFGALLARLSILAAAGCAPQYISGEERSGPDELAIVGGSAAPAGLYTHQVSIQTPGGFHFCGGSLIGDQWVLTAAHCVVDERPSSIVIEAGITRLSSNGERFGVAEIVVHPSYDASTSDNDMALLRLNGSAGHIGPVALMDEASEGSLGDPGTDAIVTGWGTLSPGGGSPDALQHVTVPVLSNAACDGAYGPQGQAITDRMVCAGILGTGGVDSCQGDSGGPLVVEGPGGAFVQNGVVSFGFGCGDPDFPGVYTRVSEFASFIAARVPDVVFADGGTVDPDPEPEPEPEPAPDDVIVLDVSSGSTSVGATLAAGETHLYSVTLDEPSDLVLFTTGATDTFGTLLDAGGATLASDDDAGAGTNFRIVRGAVDGEVLVAVQGFDGNVAGSYVLTVEADPIAPDPGTGGSQVGVGLPDIAGGDTLGVGDVHRYAFEVVGAAGIPVDLVASSTGTTDTIGTFVDSAGNTLAENDDISGNDRNFLVEASVVPGTYFLDVRAFGNGSGAYTVSIGAQ